VTVVCSWLLRLFLCRYILVLHVILCLFSHEVFFDSVPSFTILYSQGHECSFQVFLYSLCKLGCFGSTPDAPPPTATRLKAATLSLYDAYLQVTRQLQTEYMLEPAGSHGVWGLDDYHCLPFYFGACQLHADAGGDDNGGDADLEQPNVIHNDSVLQREGDRYLYLGCIRYIKQLKRGVPFFESSPMLNDISNLPTWQKVASGLLRLFEGEVLKKRQVVQHFVFGNIFAANWTPSGHPQVAPEATFRKPTKVIPRPGPPSPVQDSVGPMTRAPWNDDTGSPPSSPVSGSRKAVSIPDVAGTRAPWADNPATSSSGGAAGMPPTRAPWAK